jgi:hypothetical protein
LKRSTLVAGLALAALTFPAGAQADSPICHDGILSDDAGQGCTNDGAYAGSGDGPICHDGILSDDAGQGCADGLYDRVYRSSGSSVSSTRSVAVVSSGGGYADVPGVPSSFAACVAMRESTNGAGSSNIYGIQGPGGQGSLAAQKQAFAQMYAARGTQPWAPYDGC